MLLLYDGTKYPDHSAFPHICFRGLRSLPAVRKIVVPRPDYRLASAIQPGRSPYKVIRICRRFMIDGIICRDVIVGKTGSNNESPDKSHP